MLLLQKLQIELGASENAALEALQAVNDKEEAMTMYVDGQTTEAKPKSEEADTFFIVLKHHYNIIYFIMLMLYVMVCFLSSLLLNVFFKFWFEPLKHFGFGLACFGCCFLFRVWFCLFFFFEKRKDVFSRSK